MDFNPEDRVRVNTPGESHHNRTGTIVRKGGNGRLSVDLGDVTWLYRPSELVLVDGA
jgi:hypothetical protein